MTRNLNQLQKRNLELKQENEELRDTIKLRQEKTGLVVNNYLLHIDEKTIGLTSTLFRGLKEITLTFALILGVFFKALFDLGEDIALEYSREMAKNDKRR